MPKLTPVSWRELVEGLKLLGFIGPYKGGKHPYMVKGGVALTLPNPHRGVISIDLSQRILRLGGISREEWLNLG